MCQKRISATWGIKLQTLASPCINHSLQTLYVAATWGIELKTLASACIIHSLQTLYVEISVVNVTLSCCCPITESVCNATTVCPCADILCAGIPTVTLLIDGGLLQGSAPQVACSRLYMSNTDSLQHILAYSHLFMTYFTHFTLNVRHYYLTDQTNLIYDRRGKLVKLYCVGYITVYSAHFSTKQGCPYTFKL